MKAQTMRRVRQFHQYLGMLFAPAILFFAFSGALQTIGLHEAPTRATAPPWIVWMASVHKNQTPPRARPAPDRDEHDQPRPPRPGGAKQEPGFVPLKAFVLLMALGLIASSTLGIVIALNNRATRRGSLVMLAAGTVLPVLLMLA